MSTTSYTINGASTTTINNYYFCPTYLEFNTTSKYCECPVGLYVNPFNVLGTITCVAKTGC